MTNNQNGLKIVRNDDGYYDVRDALGRLIACACPTVEIAEKERDAYRHDMTPQQIVEGYFGRLPDRTVLDIFYLECPEDIAIDAMKTYAQPTDMDDVNEAVTQKMREWYAGIVGKVLSLINEDDVIQWGNFARVALDGRGGIWFSRNPDHDAGLRPLSVDQREHLARWAVRQ